MTETKYDNETSNFLKSIEPNLTLQAKAKKLGVTYASLHYSFKINKISYALFYKIIQNFNLTDSEKQELKSLLK